MMRRIIRSVRRRLLFDQRFGLCNSPDDVAFLRKKYCEYIGKKLNLDPPVSFNEKLQWLKLYDRKPIYTVMVDKLLVKDFVAERIGREYLIPTVGSWRAAEDIDFNSLPDRFVLKCNHNSGLGMYICRDKAHLSAHQIAKIRDGLRKGLKQDYYLAHREWPYKDVPRRIIAEEYLEVENGDLPDYKFHCFNGKVKLILLCKNRFSGDGITEDFYNENWEHLSIRRPGIPNSQIENRKPEKLEEMISLAERLSADCPFLRVDFYYVHGKIYFGELTFFPNSGFVPFEPKEWDEILGSYLRLPDGCI